MNEVFVGTAGWSIPSEQKNKFAIKGTHLEKYSTEMNSAEINSSFHREHKYATYEGWADQVPKHFRFSVKLSKYFTHKQRLINSGSELRDSLNNIQGLKEKLGVILVQLPPSLKFDFHNAKKFFSNLTQYCSCPIAIEPRHESWSEENALALLEQLGLSKVLADPEPCQISKLNRIRVERKLRYFRLHGKPDIYKSKYPTAAIKRILTVLENPISLAKQTWVIFDNTSYGHGTENALELMKKVHSQEKNNA